MKYLIFNIDDMEEDERVSIMSDECVLDIFPNLPIVKHSDLHSILAKKYKSASEYNQWLFTEFPISYVYQGWLRQDIEEDHVHQVIDESDLLYRKYCEVEDDLTDMLSHFEEVLNMWNENDYQKYNGNKHALDRFFYKEISKYLKTVKIS